MPKKIHADTCTRRVIAFDADDTLWVSEPSFVETKQQFVNLLSPYHTDREEIARKLNDTEVHNLQYFGYGVKSFTLSMLETALNITQGQLQGKEIQQIVSFAKEMLSSPVDLFEHVREVIPVLSISYTLMIITKGDLFDQERKISQSRIGEYFTYAEVVNEKNPEVYKRILAKYKIEPQHFMMVGNSLRSDILPVIAIGGQAVHIPYHLTWGHENEIDHYDAQDGYYECEHFGLLPELLNKIEH